MNFPLKAKFAVKDKSLLGRVVRRFCEAVDSPRSLTVWLLYAHNEHNQLLELEIDPCNYENPDQFRNDLACTNILSKYPGLETGRDTREVAKQAFIDAELACRITNHRLRFPSQFDTVLDRAAAICDFVLGSLATCESRALADILTRCSWGPGITSSVRGTNVSAYNKLKGDLQCTADLTAFVPILMGTIPSWQAYHLSGNPGNTVTPTKVQGNTVTFVPKNAKTDRPIAIEPHLNMFLQKGIGSVIRSRLRRVGVNLNDQSRNQELARQGSLNGHLATVDLKSASDTVSRTLVERLIPRQWCQLLGVARSPAYMLDGVWRTYYKWSSMGNGYTFELESLIFYSLARATLESLELPLNDLSVYGDDIIIPAQAFNRFKEVLEHAGFQTNAKKSFHAGPFRESCGADWFRGVHARSLYIREDLNHVQQVYKLANALRRWARIPGSGFCDPRFLPVWRELFLAVPSPLRHRIPEGFGDGGFTGTFDECADKLRTSRKSGRLQFFFKQLEFQARSRKKEDRYVAVTSALWAMEGSDTSSIDNGVFRKDLAIRPEYVDPLSPVDRTSYDLRSTGGWRQVNRSVSEWITCGAWVT